MTTPETTMTPEVQSAIDELKQAFPGHRIDVDPEAQGGAYVVVRDLPIGDRYVPMTTWVGFLLSFQYPRADVYPHFIDSTVRRADGVGHSGGFQQTSWRNAPATQVSRR